MKGDKERKRREKTMKNLILILAVVPLVASIGINAYGMRIVQANPQTTVVVMGAYNDININTDERRYDNDVGLEDVNNLWDSIIFRTFLTVLFTSIFKPLVDKLNLLLKILLDKIRSWLKHR